MIEVLDWKCLYSTVIQKWGWVRNRKKTQQSHTDHSRKSSPPSWHSPLNLLSSDVNQNFLAHDCLCLPTPSVLVLFTLIATFTAITPGWNWLLENNHMRSPMQRSWPRCTRPKVISGCQDTWSEGALGEVDCEGNSNVATGGRPLVLTRV